MRTTTALTRLLSRYGPTTVVADPPQPSGAPAPAELADVVRQAVTDALHTNGARPQGGDDPAPARYALAGEWQVRATLPSGDVWIFRADDETDALDRVRRMTNSTCVLEHRLVSAWRAVPLPPSPEPGGSAGDDEGRHSAA
jgi:hypothetical protein